MLFVITSYAIQVIMIKAFSINQFAQAILFKVLFSFRSTFNNCSKPCSEFELLVPWHFWNIPKQFRLKLLPLTFWCIALHLQWLLLQCVASNSKNVQCIGFKSHLVFTCWENARQLLSLFPVQLKMADIPKPSGIIGYKSIELGAFLFSPHVPD